MTTTRATPLRRPDLIERDAMVAALRALDTERLQSMLDRAEEHPRNKERWDSLTVAGVQMIVDPDLLRAELARRRPAVAARATRGHEVVPAEGDFFALATTCRACGQPAYWRLGSGAWEHAKGGLS